MGAINALTIDETAAPPKDDDILAAMSAVFFDDDEQAMLASAADISYSNSCQGINAINAACEILNTVSQDVSNALRSSDSICDIPLDPLITNNQGPSQSPEEIGELRTPKSKAQKSHKKPFRSKLDLDKCLEERKLRRKTERLMERQNVMMHGRKVKRNLRLLKQPQKCQDCGKAFHYTGYLEAHMR